MNYLIKKLISGNSRSAKAIRNSVFMLIIRGVSIGISFLYVPLLLGTLDDTNYGVWLTLTSLVSWVALFDIGIGNGLRNKLAHALAKQDFKYGKTVVSTAYISMLGVICILYILFLCCYKFVDWNEILAGNSVSIPALNQIVLVVFSGFLLQFFFGLINSILFALQKPALSSLISTIGQFLSYILVFVYVNALRRNSMLELGSIISFTPPCVLIITSAVLFKTLLKEIRPSIKYFKSSEIKDLFSLGIQFFVIQIITIVLFQSNNLIITHVLDSVSVVEYNIAYKYMTVMVMVFNIIATPIWSATTEAWEKNDLNWIRLTNKRLLRISMYISLIGLLMVLISPYIYRIWLKDDIQISFITTLLLFVYSSLMMFYGAYGYILNGIGKLRVQILATVIIAVMYVPLTCFMGEKIGLPGILLSFSFSVALNVLWSKIQYNKLLSGKATGIWVK